MFTVKGGSLIKQGRLANRLGQSCHVHVCSWAVLFSSLLVVIRLSCLLRCDKSCSHYVLRDHYSIVSGGLFVYKRFCFVVVSNYTFAVVAG